MKQVTKDKNREIENIKKSYEAEINKLNDQLEDNNLKIQALTEEKVPLFVSFTLT